MQLIDILVLILAIAVAGWTLYRAFFRKKEKAGGCGCAGCSAPCASRESNEQ